MALMEPAQAVAVLEPGWQDVQPLLAAASEQLQVGSAFKASLCHVLIATGLQVHKHQACWSLITVVLQFYCSCYIITAFAAGHLQARFCGTSKVRAACACLDRTESLLRPQLGELLHGEEFSMFEAMSAVEIGDPKLDAGLTVDYLVPADRWSPAAVPSVRLLAGTAFTFVYSFPWLPMATQG